MKDASMKEQLLALVHEAPNLALDKAEEMWPSIEDEIYKAAREGRRHITLAASKANKVDRGKAAAIAARAACGGIEVTRTSEDDRVFWRLSW